MKTLFIICLLIVIITLNSEQIDLQESDGNNSYRLYNHYYLYNDKSEFPRDPKVDNFKLQFNKYSETSIFQPEKTGDNIKYIVFSQADTLIYRTKSLDKLKYIDVKYKNSHIRSNVFTYYLSTLLINTLTCFMNDADFLHIFYHFIPVTLNTFTIQAGPSTYYRYKDQNYFNKKRSLQFGLGLYAGIRPSGCTHYSIGRVKDQTAVFGGSFQIQKEYLPFGLSLRLYNFSEPLMVRKIYPNATITITEDQGIVLNPALKLSCVEWGKTRINIYLGLFSNERKYKREVGNSQYGDGYFITNDGLIGNSLETELQYFITGNIACNLSLLCLSSSENSHYALLSGFSFYSSTRNRQIPVLSNFKTGVIYCNYERKEEYWKVSESPLGFIFSFDIAENHELSHSILMDFGEEITPVGHRSRYTFYLYPRIEKRLRVGLSLVNSFGQLFKDFREVFIGMKLKFPFSEKYGCFVNGDYDPFYSSYLLGMGLEYRFAKR